MMSRDSMGRRLRRLAPALVILAAVACGPFRRGSSPPPARLIFTNESLEQAAVYVAAQGLAFRRIGTVFAGHTDTLTVPADLVTRGSTLNIVARLLARSDAPQTGPVSVRAGEHYRVRLSFDRKLLSFLPSSP